MSFPAQVFCRFLTKAQGQNGQITTQTIESDKFFAGIKVGDSRRRALTTRQNETHEYKQQFRRILRKQKMSCSAWYDNCAAAIPLA